MAWCGNSFDRISSLPTLFFNHSGDPLSLQDDGSFNRYFCLKQTFFFNFQLVTPGNPYRDLEHQKMTIHVEWIESHLLLMGKYHRLDETTARHKMHMA